MLEPALELTKLNPTHVALVNALYARAIPEEVRLGTGKLSLKLSPNAEAFVPAATISVTMASSRWEVAVSNAEWLFAHSVFSGTDKTVQNLEGLPEELKAAIAETLLKPLFDGLSKALGASVLFEKIHFESATVFSAPAAVFSACLSSETVGTLPFQIAFRAIEKSSVAMLTKMVMTTPKKKEGALCAVCDEVPVRLSFQAGELRLKTEEFTFLEVGDVLVVPSWLPSSKSLLLRAESMTGNSLQALCALSGNEVKLKEMFNLAGEGSMPATDDLTVNLSFELENRTMTIGELKSLEPGYVFTLTSNPMSPVTIRANGKPVAQGRLVDLNGAIGVQISEIQEQK